MVARACELLVCLLIGSNIFSRGEFWGNAQPLYLTRELRSMSKLFGLFQVLFVFSLFLHTQAQYFMSLNWNNLYYHTGKCAKYEFTCANGDCLAKRKRCDGKSNCGDNSDEQQCRKSVIAVTVVLILESPFLCAVVIRSRYKQILRAVSSPSLSLSLYFPLFNNKSNN